MYDVIVLGATFLAAGIALPHGEKSLIIERSTVAGSEFLSALHFGSGYEDIPVNPEAKELRECFFKRGRMDEERICLCDCGVPLYDILRKIPVLFCTEIVSIKTIAGGFSCTTYGIQGYQTFEAKKIVDTRSAKENSWAKTYNVLVESDKDLRCLDVPDVKIEPWGYEKQFVVRCTVPLSADFVEARNAARKVIECLYDSARLIWCADAFDYQVKEEAKYALISKRYENPIEAFDAGLSFGKEEQGVVSF